MSAPAKISTAFVEYSDGETVFEGYVAHPEGAGKHPCVLLAHDWSGLNGGMRQRAEEVARLGYTAFAIDVYGKGVRGDEQGDNTALMAPFLADRALLRKRLMAALDAAAKHPAVDTANIGAMGYCFGGLCALDLARAAPPILKGVVSFHGIFYPPNLGDQPKITAKVLILHGWDDPMAPPDHVTGVAKEMTEAGADWQLHAYGHALHAFTFEGAYAPERGIAYDAKADRRSWAAMRSFFEEVFA
ncbi:dienelactone hydrolase family protein [Parvibaculum sp.]|uniref:dienelactone hydrolase family protein n=1 Tax=Parvibaculum sp. TaxID=2024848 RepID=UPI00349FF97B